MSKFPGEEGEGLVEWILIVILAIMVLVTIYLLLRPAISTYWQEWIQSIQS